MAQNDSTSDLADREKKRDMFNDARVVLKDWQTGTFPKEFEFAGFTFTSLPSTFTLETMGHDGFAEHFPVPKHKEKVAILEVGCGTGCLSSAIYLRNSDRIARVLATDINPEAVQNTQLNFARHKIPGEARESDVFAAVSKDELFDVIMWNMPFYNLELPEGSSTERLLDMCLTDPNYSAIERYIKEAPAFLNDGGLVLIGFSSDCGDLPLLEKVAKKHGKKLRLVWKSEERVVDILFELFALESVVD